MIVAFQQSSSLSPADWLGGDPLLTAGGIALLLLVVVAAIVIWNGGRARRRLRGEIREIVAGLEQLRSGRVRSHLEVSPSSPMGLVSDALHRLSHDLNARWAEAETAAERWRALIDASRDVAVITTDNDGDIRSFSGGAQTLFGWDEGEVLSRPAAVVFDESSYKDLLPKLARKSLRDKGIEVQCKLLRRDGSSFDAEVNVRGLSSTASQPLGFMMVVRDITEQLQTADELRESEERYRGLVEGLGEGVVIVREGRVIYTNPAAEHLCGGSSAELLDTPWRERVSTRDVLVTEETLADLERRPGATHELGCTLVGHRGETRAEVRIKAGSLSYAGAPAVLLLIHDETMERRIEAELRRNEARLDAVLEATSDGILVLADDQYPAVVQMTNQAFCEMFGLRLGDVLGATDQVLLGLLRRRGQGAEHVAEWIAAGGSAPRESAVTIGGEGARDLQVTVSALAGRDDRRLGRVVACRDVTAQRESERELQAQAERLQLSKVELEQSYKQLREVNARLEDRGDELDTLNQELRRLDEMKSNLLGNVSHELQTPLVSIRGYTEMILKERLGPISQEQRKGLELSLKNIDRLISMIDNLLAFNRTDPQAAQLKPTRFDLRPLVEEVVELLRSKVAAKGVDVSMAFEREDIPILADRDKVLQVFLNLLSNAIKFNRQDGRVQVSGLRGPTGYATLRVRDTGMGIPAESLGRIFERHFRVQQESTQPAEGSGIGLSIVRDILRLHGCTIEVDSRINEGTEFTFTLPLAEESMLTSPEAHPAADEPPTMDERSVQEAEPPQQHAQPAAEEPPAPSIPRPRPRLRVIRPTGSAHDERAD